MVISMIFDFGSLRVEIDVHKIREFYDLAPIITDGCSCDGCRNYISAIDRFPPPVKKFFSKTGFDAKKATEIITWHSEGNGSALHYGGFYHLCGRLIKGNDYWKEDGGRDEDGLYLISEGYLVGFTNRISLPEDYLPAPAIQMEIDFHAVPWMLEKENSY